MDVLLLKFTSLLHLNTRRQLILIGKGRVLCAIVTTLLLHCYFIITLKQASTIDPDRKGACPMCHRYFMALYLKYEADDIDLVVTRVKNTKTLPVCLDGQNFQVRKE